MARYQKPAPLNLVADDVWGAAVAAQRINGAYVKLSMLSESDPDMNQRSNRQIIDQLLADPRMITTEDFEQGKKVRSFFQAYTFKILKGIKLSDFDNTAMLIANRDTIDTNYDIAVIASLPSSYERGVKRQEGEQRINFANGGFIGSLGDKVTLELDVVKSVFSQKWNVYYVTGLTPEEKVVFFGHKAGCPIGTKVKVQGTVKAHRDNSTQLNRVKII
jgi:hypothetical protein